MVLNNHLTNWMEDNNILADEQNGFHCDCSCLDHLYTLHKFINYQKSRNKSSYICFVDTKKAFDGINWICVWYKLQKAGLQENILGQSSHYIMIVSAQSEFRDICQSSSRLQMV